MSTQEQNELIEAASFWENPEATTKAFLVTGKTQKKN